VGGVFAKAPVLLMVVGAAAALACWDLATLEEMMGAASQPQDTRRIERKHLQWLLVAIGAGISLAVISALVTLQIPLVVLILLVLIDVVSVNYTIKYLAK